MPIGTPFDCRSVNENTLTQSEIAIAYPRNGQALLATDSAFTGTNLNVTVAYSNFLNNNDSSVPTERKVVRLRVLVNSRFYRNVDLGTPPTEVNSFFVEGSKLVRDGLTRNTITIIPVNQSESLAIGYNTSEIGFTINPA